jgi:flagellum-specific peptidoglycan hydrolase FlgJ
MGAIEDEYNRGQQGGQPQKPALLNSPAAAPAEPQLQPQKAALLNTPSPGQRLRAAAPTGPTLGDTIAQRAAAAPAAPAPVPTPAAGPVEPNPLRNVGSGEPLGQTVAGRAGPPAPSPTRLALEGQAPSNLSQTVAARAPQGPQLPPEQNPLRVGQPTGPALGETIAQRAAAAAGQPAPQGAPAPQGNVMDKLRAAQLRYGGGEENTLKQTIAGRTPAGPYNGVPPAAGAAAGAPPAGTPPGMPPGTAGEPGLGSRAGKAMADAARAAMPGGPAIVNGGTAAGKAIASVAKKSLPWVAPIVEGVNVARVANDPQATKGDVVQQAVEGTGRWGSSVGGATLLGGAGTLVAGPVGAAIGGVVGGVAGYYGGDAVISKLRSAFGLGDKSPIEKTAERADAARKAQAQLPAISEPVVQPPKAAPTAAPATAAPAQAPAGARTPANTAAYTPTAQAAPQVSAIAQQLAALQAQQDASPIARTTLGSGGSQVFYKDGSMSPLLPGQAVPDDVAQFNNLHQRMQALRSGQPLPEDMPAAPAAQAPGNTLAPSGTQPRDGKLGKVAAFAEKYAPQAERVAAQVGVAPELILAKWGHETGWGKSVIPGTNNLGNIMAGKGQSGVVATDNMTGSRDKYLNFENPDAFADHYAGLINSRYKGAVGAGDDMGKFAAGLVAGGYAQDPKYASRLGAAYQTLLKARGAAPAGPSVAAAAQGQVVPQPASGINEPVHVIKGMQQSMAVPTEAGYTEVPKTVFDAARRSPNGFAQNGAMDTYLNNEAQNANFRANPVGASLAQEALRGQFQNQGQEIQGQYGVAQHQVAAAGHVAAAQAQAAPKENHMVVVPGNEVIDPNTHLPVKQPGKVVYMKDGKPEFAEAPKEKATEQEAHAQARAAIANKADKTAVNARLIANGYKPLPN